MPLQFQTRSVATSADERLQVRPETSRRRPEVALWSDTLPCWFRSEGFAEDLCQAPGARPADGVSAGRRVRLAAGPLTAVAAILAVTRLSWVRRTA